MGESEVGLLLTVVSMFVGAVITWIVAKHYYVRAGIELAQESVELRRLTTLVLRSMEEANLVELTRDASGKIIGLVMRSTVKITGTASLSAKAEVIRHKSDDRV